MKSLVIGLIALSVVGCSSNAARDQVAAHNKAVAESMGKPLIQLDCPLEGCVITGLTVNNPNSQRGYVAMPKSMGEKIVGGVLQSLPVLGNIWLQDRNGQRSVDMTQINSNTTLGLVGATGNVISGALNAMPDALVVDPVVVQPNVQVVDQPSVVVVDQPSVIDPVVIQVPTPYTP